MPDQRTGGKNTKRDRSGSASGSGNEKGPKQRKLASPESLRPTTAISSAGGSNAPKERTSPGRSGNQTTTRTPLPNKSAEPMKPKWKVSGNDAEDYRLLSRRLNPHVKNWRWRQEMYNTWRHTALWCGLRPLKEIRSGGAPSRAGLRAILAALNNRSITNASDKKELIARLEDLVGRAIEDCESGRP